MEFVENNDNKHSTKSDGNTSFLRAARNGQLEKVLEHLKSNIDINTSNANGLNALHLASKDGHVEIVEELLKRGAIVDAATKKGNTALHIASLAGQEEVVKLLVQHGASVNVQSQNGFTPLYMAAQENHDNVVKYLLANGANQSLSTEDGFTPLAVAMQQGHDKVVTVLLENDTRGKVRLPALHIAAKKDDVKAAKLLLENEHNPDVTSKSGFTPLHIASHYGNQSIANLLVQKGADVNYSAKHNITPLHVAAKWGKTNMVALLLEQGAHIEAKTRDGLTPLHCAARSGHEQVVDMLLERGAPISSKTKNGLAPLHMAAQGDHVDAGRILLYHRAPVDEVTVDYLTALHVAAHCGHVRVAKLLLDRQADPNARALNGFTPLHIACKKNRIKVVELLLKHKASIGATTESGLTPLHVASFMGCMNIVIYLLQHSASPDAPTVRGETPLHLAARANQTDIIRILLRNGAQVDARAREQQTPLHIASRLGNVDIVMLLLQHGAQVDNTTKDMYTALHIASKEGQDEVAAVLIDNGASLNATTKKGFTPLHLAAKYGHLKVAKLLVQKDAPVDAQGKNGVTPLHVASHYDHQNVALLLLDKGASPHANAKNGHTPLHIAARKNQMDIANTLLEYGAQPNAESKAGFTPLHLSSQEGHKDISSLLLEHKATPSHQAKNGLTPLHLCAQEDRVPVAEILVKNGADIDAATKAGYTPLHTACHYGQANMVKFLVANGAEINSTTALGYTPLHQAAQQGHANIVNILLENSAQPNAITIGGQTPLQIAQKLGYITVIDTLKTVTEPSEGIAISEEKYRVVAPEAMHETFFSDSEEEGEDTLLGDQTYRYLTADEMKSLGDDSLPIDVTRDERIDSNRMVTSDDSNMMLSQHIIEDTISPEHIHPNYVEYIKRYTPDNVDIARHPVNIGFLVSFLVDARGGAMRGCRHSGVRVIVPPRCAASPTRITCRYVRPKRTPHPPPLMEGEALASRVLELGPVGSKFLGPVIIEVPHFAALRGKEREIVILRSDNGESWKEHSIEATEDLLNEVLRSSFDPEDLSQMEDLASGRITRIITQDFPQYFAVVSRVRQEVHAIGPEGGMVSSTVVPQVQAVFPQGALTKKIKVGLQAQPIDPELTAKLLGHGVAVSPVVTVEPRRRKFHKAITLSMPAPRAHSQGMINQYSGSAPTLRLLCSITGGTSRAQWEDVTGSTPLTFVNDCVSFTTTVSARFWLMDCRNIGDATKMATELYREAIHVPFMAKFVVFAKRVDPLEARLRVFCMTDDKEEKTLEFQEQFTEVAKSRDVEVLEGKMQYIEFAGNLVPIAKSGEQLQFAFRAFRENRLPFSVRIKDQHAEAVSRCLFMKDPKVQKGEQPQQAICILNIVLPDDIVSETISLTDSESIRSRHLYLSENFDYYRQDPRLADMSNLLGEDWVLLANQLGLTTTEINVIKSEYPDSVAKQAQSMLRMWLSQYGNKAQLNTLENSLRRIGREDIINQCLNIDERYQEILRTKTEEITKQRLRKGEISKISETKENAKKKQDSFDKYQAEEKVVEPSDEEEDFNKSVPERREQIQKRLSVERTIPASSQRVEIVQEISSIKRHSLVEDKIAEVQQKTTNGEPIKISKILTKTTPARKDISETVEIKTTKTSEKTVLEMDENIEPPTDFSHTEITNRDISDRRDSDLLEEVTHRLETKKPVAKLIASEDLNSPKFSKTPPPSPADFALREQQASIDQGWGATPNENELDFRRDQKEVLSAAREESSCDQLTEAELTLTKTNAPKPKPRNQKPFDIPLNIDEENMKSEKQMSPVRDDLLDEVDQRDPSYLDTKKFWENVSKEAAQKRLSLHEVIIPNKETVTRKRTSVHEISAPVPKPRATLQSSYSVAETEKEKVAALSSTSELNKSLDLSNDSSGPIPTELTSISETDSIDLQEDKIMTEYQSSFTSPSDRYTRAPFLESKPSLTKSESINSDKEMSSQNQLTDNVGYISDSEDVEHYISDSEIEDRVPQIRERQMSVFAPVTTTRQTIYERSASLPTEDLYEVSARTSKLRKQYYEEQIKKEMIQEQLTAEFDEQPSPETKSLDLSSQIFEDTQIVEETTHISDDTNQNKSSVFATEPQKDIKTSFEEIDKHVPSVKLFTGNMELNIIKTSPSVSDSSTQLLEVQNEGDDSNSRLDSMEVHVDKSEIEDSEKLIELDIDIDNLESKSCELNAKSPCSVEENIPEIRVHFSGKQRRISEESDEYDEKDETIEMISPVPEKSESESPIHQPEYRIDDVVWEVSVQSQAPCEEKTTDIILDSNIRKFSHKTDSIQEKEDDFSSSVRDESDLGSDIHQDRSDSVSDKIKSESQNDIEKIILDSLHQQKVAPDEAKIIAQALVEEIENEIQKVETFDQNQEVQKKVSSDLNKAQVSDYLRQLAEAKGLDEREVELVESVLARRQRELSKLSRLDTQASSMEITDEDLRYSGGDADYSHLLEQQMGQLEAEKLENLKNIYDSIESEQTNVTEQTECVNKFEQEYTDERTTSDHSVDKDNLVSKHDSQVVYRESVTGDKSSNECRNVIFEEDETTSESFTEDAEKLKIDVKTTAHVSSTKESPDQISFETKNVMAKEEISQASENIIVQHEIDFKSPNLERKKIEIAEKSETQSLMSKNNLETSKKIDKKAKVEEIKLDTNTQQTEQSKIESIFVSEVVDPKNKQSENIQMEQSQTSFSSIEVKEKKSVILKTSEPDENNVDSSFLEDKLEKYEKTVKSETNIDRTSSSDSRSSFESGKSPEEQFSSCSSGKKGESDPQKQYDSPLVVPRKVKSDVDTSSSSSNIKLDKIGNRKSAVDFETYSSSGESHYQSFEHDSGKSRPCSSDVEALVAAGSSEYESALTSQEVSSAKSQITSAEYQTAISSLSSKESMKSLDSESSGNLASVEVSEASETLVPTSSDLDGDFLDPLDQQLLEEVDPTWSSKSVRLSRETSDNDVIVYTGTEGSIDISEDDLIEDKPGVDIQSKMKRSSEMTFQPEPKVFTSSSPQTESDEKFGTSLDEGSILSVSLSSTSSAQLPTVVEFSRTESGLEESMTMSTESEQLIADESSLKTSRENLLAQTDSFTSTAQLPFNIHSESVTIMTSNINENGIVSASTQVRSEIVNEDKSIINKSQTKSEPEELKKKGHRRQESSAFISISDITKSDTKENNSIELIEKNKDIDELSLKEGKSYENKDIDEREHYETDQVSHKDRDEELTESDIEFKLKEVETLDLSRPSSQISKSESERPLSTPFSEEPLDSKLDSFIKHSSEITDVTDPIERPLSPELGDDETKDDTPEFSSEAQASIGELEQEYSAAVARSHEISTIESKIKSKDLELSYVKEPLEKRDSHGKSSATSSERSSFEEAEAEAAFSMVAHISPAHKIKQICPILEDEDAEKHELETRERAQKDLEIKRTQMRDQSPGSIPDIKVTQHMAPLNERNFRYPDLELEQKELEALQKSTPETPASISSKSSEDTEGQEYVLDHSIISEEPEEIGDDKIMTESKSEVGTIIEKTLKEETDKETDSPNSDSFELVEKPDLIDDFVVIEEVGREAHEFDSEGKSLKIEAVKKTKKRDKEIEEFIVKSAPTPLTSKMTDIKYYPEGSSSEELGFDFEDSPPLTQKKDSSDKDYNVEYSKELEANKKWIEEQFQGDQAAMIAAGYGYDMEFERGPLEDIKEEDINDFDVGSSRIGSLGSQKESGGSLGSVKDSYSSTPDYDVLAGRKYFTRSGDHDDVSMSSLQEFENLERAMSLETRRLHQGSQDSSSNGSFKNRYYANKTGQGDDISVSSLKEFEGLEKACIAAHTIEVKAKEEEAILSQIDECQESVTSESESCETITGTDKKVTESDEEDYEKRMFEIDEIIQQAQTNVARFIDVKENEKTESLGRGDSVEEVSKVPDLDLDLPFVKSKVCERQTEDPMVTSTDSLDLKQDKPSHYDSSDSLDQKTNALDMLTTSTDSIEQRNRKQKDTIMTDSIEVKGERSGMIASDSLELGTSAVVPTPSTDSLDEDGSRIGHDHSTSSTGKDFSSSVHENEPLPLHYMVESTESLDPTSSTATHATYQYESDSIFSGSFTSGGSNTMVSSTDTIDPIHLPQSVDIAAAVRKVWFDDETGSHYTTQYLDESSTPYVTEVIEPCDEKSFSHTIHRRVVLPSETKKITFSGTDADKQLKQFIQDFDEGENIEESEETDAAGNVHIKKIIKKRYIIKSEGNKPPEMEPFLRNVGSEAEYAEGQGVITRTVTGADGTKTVYKQQYSFPRSETTSKTQSTSGEHHSIAQSSHEISCLKDEPIGSTASHSSDKKLDQRHASDQHQLSDEMRELLKELEKDSKQ